jgi:hypothetical protein
VKGSGLRLIGAYFLVCGTLAGVPTGALALIEGRQYEMVSPIYKGGFGATHIEGIAPDGESIAYYSPGAFEGAPSGPETIDYVARRGESSWSTVPLMVPASRAPYVNERDLSPTLALTFALGKPGPNQEGAFQQGTEEEFLLHDTSLSDSNLMWETAGMPLKTLTEGPIVLKYEGASKDFCHILLANASIGQSFLLPEAENTQTQVYELDRGCGGEEVSLRLVGVKNKLGPHSEPEVISPFCKVDVGIQDYNTSAQSTFNAVAAGGSDVFFTTCVGGPAGPHQLFVRLAGTRTVEVSKPLKEACSEVPCMPQASERASVDFVGANESGTKVFFTTTAALEPITDTDSGNDLYMATIGCPASEPACGGAEKVVTSILQISHVATGAEAADVQGAVRLAPDGSRVYFVARGILTEGLNVDGHAPMKGADNLYMYEVEKDTSVGRTAFVADLCSGKELSGNVDDVHCPNPTGTDLSLWNSYGAGEEQTTGADARFLVFSTYAQLERGDTDAAEDIYRYDALTGAQDRVSIGEAGYDGNGNNSLFDATIARGHWGATRVQYQYEMDNRAISEDGSQIVFKSAERLSPAVGNGLSNVYEWHKDPGSGEGSVSLISSGGGEQPVEDIVISPNGRNIFFVTVQGLVPQDTDGAPDVYDARVEGGFSTASEQRRYCEGDACHGPLTNPAPLLIPGSVVQAPGGNFASPVSKRPAKTKKKTKAKKKKIKGHKKHKKKVQASRRSVRIKQIVGMGAR